MPLSVSYSEFQQMHCSITKRAERPPASQGQALLHCVWGHTSSHTPRKPPDPACHLGSEKGQGGQVGKEQQPSSGYEENNPLLCVMCSG